MKQTKLKRNMIWGISLLLFLFIVACELSPPEEPAHEDITITGTTYHASPNGSPDAEGTSSDPWDLNSALDGSKTIAPGDGIVIHGGVYKGTFNCNLSGTQENPVIIKAYKNQKVILDANGVDDDGVLVLNGPYINVMGLHMTNTWPDRIDTEPRTLPRTRGLYVKKPHCKIINCLIYDNNQSAIGIFAQAYSTEFYGNIVYNNGNLRVTVPSGHGLYSQSNRDYQTVEDNIFFNSMQYGFHIYTEGGEIKGFRIKGNIIFNSGSLGNLNRYNTNMFIGGKKKPGEDIVVEENHFYHGISQGKNVELGYIGENKDCIFKNNWITGGSSNLNIKNWKELTVLGNRIAGETYLGIYYKDITNPDIVNWDRNTYYLLSSRDVAFITESGGKTWEQWKDATNCDINSTFYNRAPEKNEVILKPNKYEKGRAHLVVYNWENLSEEMVDLSSVINTGESLYIYDVENIPAGPVVSVSSYNGDKVAVPLDLNETAKPFGNLPITPPHTGNDFGVYLIRSTPL